MKPPTCPTPCPAYPSGGGMLGRADTGLCGPYTLPPPARVAYARGHSALRERVVVPIGEADTPMFTVAVAPPLDVLRTLAAQTARLVWQHHAAGDSTALFAVFGQGGRGRRAIQAWVDWALPLPTPALLTARGLGWVGQHQLRLHQRWTSLQREALAIGRYFPPPVTLRTRLWRDGRVQAEVAFTAGYLPGNAWLVHSLDALGQAIEAGDLLPGMSRLAGSGPITPTAQRNPADDSQTRQAPRSLSGLGRR